MIVFFHRAAFKYGDLFVYICIPIDNYYAEQQFINIFSVCFCRCPCLSTLDLCILNNVWLAMQILILLHLVAIYARFSIQRHSIYITSFLRHRGNEVYQTILLCAAVFDAMYSPICCSKKACIAIAFILCYSLTLILLKCMWSALLRFIGYTLYAFLTMLLPSFLHLSSSLCLP